MSVDHECYPARGQQHIKWGIVGERHSVARQHAGFPGVRAGGQVAGQRGRLALDTAVMWGNIISPRLRLSRAPLGLDVSAATY